MITVPELAADALGEFLTDYMQRRYGSTETGLVELVPSIARIALECIGNSDALYHNIEHTMLVTLAGHDILRGRALHNHMSADDYAHVIVACLTHDIGYVRGILPGDDDDGFVIDSDWQEDQAAAWRVRRGAARPSRRPLEAVHHGAHSRHGRTRRRRASHARSKARGFRPACRPRSRPSTRKRRCVRAADLIGQLGDPHYIRKANALYYEFEEAGLNRQLGYEGPADLVDKYPQFYWNSVAPYVQTAIRYLNVTASGRQWVANLYSNIFRAERDLALMGPQK